MIKKDNKAAFLSLPSINIINTAILIDILSESFFSFAINARK